MCILGGDRVAWFWFRKGRRRKAVVNHELPCFKRFRSSSSQGRQLQVNLEEKQQRERGNNTQRTHRCRRRKFPSLWHNVCARRMLLSCWGLACIQHQMVLLFYSSCFSLLNPLPTHSQPRCRTHSATHTPPVAVSSDHPLLSNTQTLTTTPTPAPRPHPNYTLPLLLLLPPLLTRQRKKRQMTAAPV